MKWNVESFIVKRTTFGIDVVIWRTSGSIYQRRFASSFLTMHEALVGARSYLDQYGDRAVDVAIREDFSPAGSSYWVCEGWVSKQKSDYIMDRKNRIITR